MLKYFLVQRPWPFFILCLGLAVVISPWDRPVALWAYEHREDPWMVWAREYTDFGEGGIYIVGSLLLGLILTHIVPRFVSNHLRAKMIALGNYFTFCFLAFATTGIILMLAKIAIGRYRPLRSGEFEHLRFEHFSLDHWHHSFPSGHTQVVFTFALLIALRFPRLTTFVMTYASILAFTRVLASWHFPSDVFGGLAIAWLGVHLTTKWTQKLPLKWQ